VVGHGLLRISDHDREELRELKVVGRPVRSKVQHKSVEPAKGIVMDKVAGAGGLEVVGASPRQSSKPLFLLEVDSESIAAFICEAPYSPRTCKEVAQATGLGPSMLTAIEAEAQRAAAAEGQAVEEDSPKAEFMVSQVVRGLSGVNESYPNVTSERLKSCVPAKGVLAPMDWCRLAAAAATELLSAPADGEAALCVEVNSGGQAFFGMLSAAEGSSMVEEGVVIKFCAPRHVLQSEQMAAELAWHLGVQAPQSRLLLKAHDKAEWHALADAAAPLCADLADAMGNYEALLLLQFIPNRSLKEETEAFEPGRLVASAAALGRLLALDLLLGNQDRLPVGSLSWRGNPTNVLWASLDQRCVPIDAVVARRPPKMLVQQADKMVGRVLETSLSDAQAAHDLLIEAVSCNAAAVAAIEKDWSERSGSSAAGSAATGAVGAFQQGMRASLDLVLSERELLGMVADVVRSWLDEFQVEIKSMVEEKKKLSETRQIQRINREAGRSEDVSACLASWAVLLREKSLSLQRAVREWSSRRGMPTVLSFRGFLGDSVLSPIADAYELVVRLQQLTARAKVMAAAVEDIPKDKPEGADGGA